MSEETKEKKEETPEGKLDQKKVIETRLSFASRLAGEKFSFNGVTYHMEALPALLAQYVEGEAARRDGSINHGIITAGYARFGISAIEGLKDEDGEEVEYEPELFHLLSESFAVVPMRIINGLPPAILTNLANVAINLTHLSPQEKKKADFTGASQSEASDETPGKEKR